MPSAVLILTFVSTTCWAVSFAPVAAIPAATVIAPKSLRVMSSVAISCRAPLVTDDTADGCTHPKLFEPRPRAIAETSQTTALRGLLPDCSVASVSLVLAAAVGGRCLMSRRGQLHER